MKGVEDAPIAVFPIEFGASLGIRSRMIGRGTKFVVPELGERCIIE